MAVGADTIAQQLRRLLPHGAAWDSSPTSTTYKLLLAGADELKRIYGRVTDLLSQAHPDTVDELLAEWEAEYALSGGGGTAARRAAIKTAMRRVGGQSRQYFIDVAAGLGIVITITEPTPFYVGTHGCGDAVGEIAWAFTWIVTAPAGADVAALSTALQPIKPAHTTLIIQTS